MILKLVKHSSPALPKWQIQEHRVMDILNVYTQLVHSPNQLYPCIMLDKLQFHSCMSTYDFSHSFPSTKKRKRLRTKYFLKNIYLFDICRTLHTKVQN